MTEEFGHFAAIVAGFCVDGWGAGPFTITAGGKTFRFGDSDRFGPYLADKHGDPTNKDPPARSPFWRSHRIWKYQGRRLADDGVTCVWREPKPEKVWRVDKRNALVIERGEPDGEMIEATPDEVAAWRGSRVQAAERG